MQEPRHVCCSLHQIRHDVRTAQLAPKATNHPTTSPVITSPTLATTTTCTQASVLAASPPLRTSSTQQQQQQLLWWPWWPWCGWNSAETWACSRALGTLDICRNAFRGAEAESKPGSQALCVCLSNEGSAGIRSDHQGKGTRHWAITAPAHGSKSPPCSCVGSPRH